MDVPDGLKDAMAMWRNKARTFRDGYDLFGATSWAAVMLGQRIVPRGYHPIVDQMPEAALAEFVERVRQVVANCVEAMPSHQAFVDQHCKAPPP